MKRVIVAADAVAPKSKYASYAKSIDNFIKDAKRKLNSGEIRKAEFTLDRAQDHLDILTEKAKSEDAFNDFQPSYSKYHWAIKDLRNEIEDLKKDSYYKENPVKWEDLNGSEQYAVELAHIYMNRELGLESAASRACNNINDANANPEYKDESWYQEEADLEKVINYLKSNP